MLKYDIIYYSLKYICNNYEYIDKIYIHTIKIGLNTYYIFNTKKRCFYD